MRELLPTGHQRHLTATWRRPGGAHHQPPSLFHHCHGHILLDPCWTTHCHNSGGSIGRSGRIAGHREECARYQLSRACRLEVSVIGCTSLPHCQTVHNLCSSSTNSASKLVVEGEGDIARANTSCHQCCCRVGGRCHRSRPLADVHHVCRGLDVAAVCVVRHVGHRHEGVIQRLAWGDPPLLVHSQHPLEQVNELPPVHLLCQQLPALQVSRHIHLPHVLQTVENVLPGLLRLYLGLALMLLWCLQTPKRIAGVAIAIKEFDRCLHCSACARQVGPGSG